MEHREVGRCWNENTEVWTSLSRAGYDTYRDHLNTPAFLAMLPDVKGLCGLEYVYDMETFTNFARSQPDKYPEEGGYLGNVQQAEYSQFPTVTEALLKRGYGEEVVKSILAENWLRVLGQVWK